MDINQIQPLSKEAKQIVRLRSEIVEKLKNTPPEGIEVEYLGKKFFVKQGVFWPHDDSKPLVENFEIKSGQQVLDVCTGAGTIAIFAALKGAARVVALDINPDAVASTKINAQRFGVEEILDARVSDVFSALEPEEKFDVITCNPPFSDLASGDLTEGAIKDEGLHVHNALFDGLDRHLKTGGRVYLSQANFGNVEDMLKLAETHGLSAKPIGSLALANDPRVFYAFELMLQ